MTADMLITKVTEHLKPKVMHMPLFQFHKAISSNNTTLSSSL